RMCKQQQIFASRIRAPGRSDPERLAPENLAAERPTQLGRTKIAESPVSEPSENTAESQNLAWDHLYASSSPGLRRWLTTGQPVALHQDMLMVAVPNIFTRNQLENRFRLDIESLLSGYFGRNIQLAVIVDESLRPADESDEAPEYDDTSAQKGLDHND